MLPVSEVRGPWSAGRSLQQHLTASNLRDVALDCKRQTRWNTAGHSYPGTQLKIRFQSLSVGSTVDSQWRNYSSRVPLSPLKED